VPEDLERVVLRCLAKKPDERYPDVKALALALSACASAADWEAEQADRWWAENFQSVPIDSPPQAVGVES
jgi:serine/threonine-protein kinase